MGNEGTGSLFSVLKSKHWAEHVTVGGVDPARGFSFFKVRITLTPDGFTEVNNVIRHVFQVGMKQKIMIY
jgi:insulysin